LGEICNRIGRKRQTVELCGVVGVESDGMTVKGIYMNLGGLIVQVDDRNAYYKGSRRV